MPCAICYKAMLHVLMGFVALFHRRASPTSPTVPLPPLIIIYTGEQWWW